MMEHKGFRTLARILDFGGTTYEMLDTESKSFPQWKLIIYPQVKKLYLLDNGKYSRSTNGEVLRRNFSHFIIRSIVFENLHKILKVIT